MSTETLEAPPVAHGGADDAASLEAQFNSSLAETQAARGEEAQPDTIRTEAPKAKAPESKAPPATTEDDGIPEQFIKTEQPKTEKEVEPAKNEFSEEPPKEIKGAARDAFKKLQQAADAKIKAQEQRIADYEKKLAERGEVKPSEDQQKALQAASERAAALEQELERAAYERSPKFQKFGKEVAAEINAAKSYLEGSGVDASVLDAAANVTGAQRIKILRDSGMEPEIISLVGSNLARADAIRRDRDESLTNWKANQERELQEQGTVQAAEERRRQEAEQAVFADVGKKMKSTVEAFQRVEGNEKWNAIVEKNEKDAEEFFAGKKSLQELAELAYLGVSARTTQDINKGLRNRLAAAQEELSRLRAAQPGTGHSADVKVSGEPKSEREGYESTFNSALAAVKGQ